jgi:hypothetical protein
LDVELVAGAAVLVVDSTLALLFAVDELLLPAAVWLPPEANELVLPPDVLAPAELTPAALPPDEPPSEE